MGIKVICRAAKPSAFMSDMKIGDIGIVHGTAEDTIARRGRYEGHIVLCVYGGQVVSLTNPEHIWSGLNKQTNRGQPVTILPPGTQIVLEVVADKEVQTENE